MTEEEAKKAAAAFEFPPFRAKVASHDCRCSICRRTPGYHLPMFGLAVFGGHSGHHLGDYWTAQAWLDTWAMLKEQDEVQ